MKNPITLNEYEEAHNDAAADAYAMEEEERIANEAGICVHCHEPKGECSGYKCWK